MDTNVRINCETNGFEEEEYNMAQNIIGERIAGLLREQGKTQRKLAEQVGITEVSMSRYIKGDRAPKGPILANIAKALHTTTDYLLGNEKNSNDPEMEWIPCTERLPEKSGRYLVTRKFSSLFSLLDDVFIVNYSELMGVCVETKIWWISNPGTPGFEELDDVVAWMPLPDPYMENEKVCKDCHYNDGDIHAECIICDKKKKMKQTDCFSDEEEIIDDSTVHAHWIKGTFSDVNVTCSNCNFHMCIPNSVIPKMKYCPNCGAKINQK